MLLLEGKPIKERIEKETLLMVYEMRRKNQIPHLGVILVGNRVDSEIYVSIKKKRAQELGIDFSLYRFTEQDSEQCVIDTIEFLNNDESINGIIVQLPLPENFNTDKVINSILNSKDVDDLKNTNQFEAPSPSAILEIIKEYDIDTKDKNIVILGRGRLIGRPLEKMLKSQNLKAEAIDNESKNLIQKLKQADVVIAATGTPGIITEDTIKKNSILICSGDEANFDRVKNHVEALTPIKGGVGPVTVALLLKNVVLAAKNKTT